MEHNLKQFLLEKLPIELTELIEDKICCPRWTTIQNSKLIICFDQIISWYDLLLAEIWWLYNRDKCEYKHMELLLTSPINEADFHYLESFIKDLKMHPNQVIFNFTDVFSETL